MLENISFFLSDVIYVGRVRFAHLRSWIGLVPSANQARSGLTRDEIQSHAEYAWNVARSHFQLTKDSGCAPTGLPILELGPGANFGVVLALADMLDASEIAVCDQFLTPWNGDYHNRLYGLLADLLEKAGWSCERTRQASIKGHHSLVEQYADGIENIEAKADRFAITVSQAVLEHVRDHQVAFANLYRITKPKGWGFHQVDFRDHRDFSKPLRLASLSFGEFQRLFAVSHGECGTWYRPAEMAKMIEEAGFSVTTIANGSAKPEQVAAIMTKIPPERKLSENDIAVTSALFSIRK